jgi:hypothetical protein
MAIRSNFPSIKPSLLLDFANTKQLDPRITFTRATTATYYDGVTTAKAEENLFTRSQEFDTIDWTKTGCSVTANTSSAPDGTTTADTLTASASTSVHNIQQPTTVSGAPIVISIFAKAGTHSFLQIFQGNAGINYANFNLSTGALGTVGAAGTASITDAGNGWYRCSFVFTPLAISAVRFALISSATAAYNESWTTAGTETVLLWGAQLEQRSSVTAYTATTTQAITNYIPVLQTAASGVARFDHNPITDESLGLLIEEQRTNLLLRSDDFANASWTKGGTTITANSTVAPDGTITADTLVENTANSQHQTFQAVTLTAAPYTWSVYAKQSAGNKRWLSMYPQGTGVNAYAVFDVSLGTVTLTGLAQYLSSSITPVGNGWYRCAITFTGAAVSINHVAYLSDSATVPAPVYTGDGWSGLFLWGAQLEAGSFATSYIPTVAASVTRNADAASMTGTNFSSWYSAAEGTFVGSIGNLASSSSTQVPLVSSGDTNNRVELRAVGNAFTHSRAIVATSGVTQADISITTLASTAQRNIGLAYKTDDFFIAGNGSAGQTDNSGTVPTVSQLQIGTAPYDSNIKTNGTIRKIAYYPIRVTNANLQALTS